MNLVNKQISYFFSLRCFLNLIKFMSMNFKLINLMSMNFVNKQISYFFPLRCFLNLIKFMLMNFKLINLMSMNFKLINLMLINFKLINFMLMNFVNKQISYFFPLRCFLILFDAFWCFFVLVKSYRKKKKV